MTIFCSTKLNSISQNNSDLIKFLYAKTTGRIRVVTGMEKLIVIFLLVVDGSLGRKTCLMLDVIDRVYAANSSDVNFSELYE